MFQDGQVAATVPIFNSYNEKEGHTIEVNHFPKLLNNFFLFPFTCVQCGSKPGPQISNRGRYSIS